MSDYPPKDTLVWDNMDQFCVNLTHNMKVYFKVNGSLLIKNFSNRNCIAVAGEVGNNQTRLFSLHRDGIKVVHNNNNCLGIQIIEEIINPFCNSMCTPSNPCIRGTVTTMAKAQQRELHHDFISCVEVFNFRTTPMDITTRDRAVMLMLLCFYKKKADGETIFRFNNGIEIIQYPSGYVKIFMKMSKATIMMDPNVAAAICIDDCNICTSRNNINARKGDMMINAINGVIRSQTPIQ